MRLAVALAAGGAIELDREWLGKPAGLKTHMLFALACAMMSIMAIDLYLMESDRGPGSNPDATCILQGIITGMSFLGAGAIIRGQHKVHGLTTGAGGLASWRTGNRLQGGPISAGRGGARLGLVTLIFIRMLDPREIRKRQLEIERAAETDTTRLPSTSNTIQSD